MFPIEVSTSRLWRSDRVLPNILRRPGMIFFTKTLYSYNQLANKFWFCCKLLSCFKDICQRHSTSVTLHCVLSGTDVLPIDHKKDTFWRQYEILTWQYWNFKVQYPKSDANISVLRHAQGTPSSLPPWILKRVGLETIKRIAMFPFF